MKSVFITLVAIISYCYCLGNDQNKVAVSDSIPGDYNGDGQMEYMWAEFPEIDTSGVSCTGECECTIFFSNKNIPPIKIKNCIQISLGNLKDLNHNKTDEVGFLTMWFTGCSSGYYTYTLIKNKWIKAIEPFYISCNYIDEIKDFIKSDKHKKGNAIITYTDFDKAFNTIEKSKSVPIKYYNIPAKNQ